VFGAGNQVRISVTGGWLLRIHQYPDPRHGVQPCDGECSPPSSFLLGWVWVTTEFYNLDAHTSEHDGGLHEP